MATKKCPVCGVSVKLENLEKHVKGQHPRAKVDVSGVLTQRERQEAKRASAPARPPMSSRGKTLIVIITLVLAFILILIAFNPFRGVGLSVGSAAPDFTASTCPSGSVTLSTYRGSPVVLELMDVDCPYCQQEAPVLRAVYQNFTARGVRFLSLSLIDFVPEGGPDNCQTIAIFQSTWGTTWTYALDDARRTVRAAYQVSGTPTTYILDRNGVIAEIIVGRARGGYADYAAALNRVLG